MLLFSGIGLAPHTSGLKGKGVQRALMEMAGYRGDICRIRCISHAFQLSRDLSLH